ncbi:hypothetical protein TRVL_00754 [Trypanosoma vivax]|nr:hypothetical protein TRVL_00754 [Trypanosoma vivax]
MLMVIGPNDSSLFECEETYKNDQVSLSNQLTLFASLDLLEDAMWKSADCFLPSIDKAMDGKYHVSAYVGFAPIKLLLMSGREPDKNTRQFLTEAYGACVRYLLNPLASPDVPVTTALAEDLRSMFQRSLRT